MSLRFTMEAVRRLKQISMIFSSSSTKSKFNMHFTANMCNSADDAKVLRETFQDITSNLSTSEVRCNTFMEYYENLQKEKRGLFLAQLGREYGADRESIHTLAYNIVSPHEKGEASMLSTHERLRLVLRPRYKTLFTHLGRVEGGVKFLVDLRADVINMKQTTNCEINAALYQELNSTLREILLMWFTVGFLNLERITWNSPCDLVQKISKYEAVHRIRTWEDIKRRVGPYRRCYIFTHSSMPREPVVVLHTALTNEISSNIHDDFLKNVKKGQVRGVVEPKRAQVPNIIHNARFQPSFHVDDSYTDFLSMSSGNSAPTTPTSPEVSSTITLASSMDQEKEDPAEIKCAVFYSITSTQRGLQGIDLGNYLIKSVVRKLQEEFPYMSQFSSLSPIPGFRDWLISTLNHSINMRNAGEDPSIPILLQSELSSLAPYKQEGHLSPLDTFKDQVASHQWVRNAALSQVMKGPLLRLCAHYLYVQKRRNFALNPVANFHLSNGATLWRINFHADMSVRGLNNSCTMMVNYRYFLDKTQENSRLYLENHKISASDAVLALLSNAENRKETSS